MWSFDTIDLATSPVFEAENFNIDGGQYHNDPVPSYSATNSYYFAGSTPDVDFLELSTNRPTGEEWRYQFSGNPPADSRQH